MALTLKARFSEHSYPQEVSNLDRQLLVTSLTLFLDKNFWFCFGDLANVRFFSRFIALQVKADLAGVPFKPYIANRPKWEPKVDAKAV